MPRVSSPLCSPSEIFVIWSVMIVSASGGDEAAERPEDVVDQRVDGEVAREREEEQQRREQREEEVVRELRRHAEAVVLQNASLNVR